MQQYASTTYIHRVEQKTQTTIDAYSQASGRHELDRIFSQSSKQLSCRARTTYCIEAKIHETKTN